MFKRDPSQNNDPDSGSRIRGLFRRSWRRLADFAFLSHGTMALTALLLIALATASVYGLVWLLHFLGVSRQAARIIGIPAAMLVSWFGTSLLNSAFRHLVLWIRGEKPKRPAALDEADRPFPDEGPDRVDLSSVSGRLLRNGSWICPCGKTHPFSDAVCSCGRPRPEESDW